MFLQRKDLIKLIGKASLDQLLPPSNSKSAHNVAELQLKASKDSDLTAKVNVTTSVNLNRELQLLVGDFMERQLSGDSHLAYLAQCASLNRGNLNPNSTVHVASHRYSKASRNSSKYRFQHGRHSWRYQVHCPSHPLCSVAPLDDPRLRPGAASSFHGPPDRSRLPAEPRPARQQLGSCESWSPFFFAFSQSVFSSFHICQTPKKEHLSSWTRKEIMQLSKEDGPVSPENSQRQKVKRQSRATRDVFTSTHSTFWRTLFRNWKFHLRMGPLSF